MRYLSFDVLVVQANKASDKEERDTRWGNILELNIILWGIILF
jgi:hypothetical protein